ncbi:MAG: tRNA (guanosine(46)-N7)-methyltransferase TrmB [Bacillota bacterium]|nr:tRNA (guanosine(46)-N7)-methyltransferase TrmB [Bacillota bacterium]
MRQRKVKNEGARLAAMAHYTAGSPREMKGSWRELAELCMGAGERPAAVPVALAGGGRTGGGPGAPPEKAASGEEREAAREVPLFLELGCGRGHFLTALAQAHPGRFYIGAEGRSSIVLRALELADSLRLPNVIFIAEFISRVEDYFAEGELAGIYLNFSDPWPKARYAKHRLTHRSFLEGYKKAMVPGGLLEIKTDNDALFAFTLEELAAAGYELLECTGDLHGTELPARLVTSQYEERFLKLGEKINYCMARTPERRP